MFYNVVNNASAIITSPHTISDGVLHINPIGIFGSGGFPIRVTCVRQSDNATVIYSIGSSGATSLNITGVLENTADINLAANDICQADITAGTFSDIHAAINAISASGGGGGSSPVGTSGAIPIYNSTGLTEDPSGFFYDRTNRRLGIGTNAPSGQVQINTISATRKGLIIKGFSGQSADLLELQNNTGTVLTCFDSAGKLAIGTTSTIYPLTVKSGSAGFVFDAANQVLGTTFGADGSLEIRAEDPTSTNGGSIFFGGSSRGDNRKSAIVFSVNNTEQFRLDGDFSGHTAGNFGFGTNTPLAKVQINTSSASAKGLVVKGFTSQSANLFEGQVWLSIMIG